MESPRAETKSRVWKKIGMYYGLTLAFSAVFQALEVRAPNNITLVTGEMWCPALAAVITKLVFGEHARDLGWSWGPIRAQAIRDQSARFERE